MTAQYYSTNRQTELVGELDGYVLYFLAVLCLEQMTNKEINQLIVKVGKKLEM